MVEELESRRLLSCGCAPAAWLEREALTAMTTASFAQAMADPGVARTATDVRPQIWSHQPPLPRSPVPLAPSALHAVGTFSSAIAIRFRDNSSNETEFVVERAIGG